MQNMFMTAATIAVLSFIVLEIFNSSDVIADSDGIDGIDFDDFDNGT